MTDSSFTRDNRAKDWYKARVVSLGTYPKRLKAAWYILTMRDYVAVYKKRGGVVANTSLLGESLATPVSFINLLQQTTKSLRKFLRDDVPKGYVLESIDGIQGEKELKKVVTSVYKGQL